MTSEERLERLLKAVANYSRITDYCRYCRHINDPECTGPPIYCKSGSAYSLNESRFIERYGDVN